MKKIYKTLMATALLPLVFTQPTYAEQTAFSEAVKQKCIIADASERRTRTEEFTPLEDKIMKLERKSCHMLQSGDIEGFVSVFANDGFLFPPGLDYITGSGNIRQFFAEMGKVEGVEFSWEPIDAYAKEGSDFAWAYGLIRLKMPDADMEMGK